jgi:hypothetical protein
MVSMENKNKKTTAHVVAEDCGGSASYITLGRKKVVLDVDNDATFYELTAQVTFELCKLRPTHVVDSFFNQECLDVDPETAFPLEVYCLKLWQFQNGSVAGEQDDDEQG